jgi:hypothetical protein
MNALWRLDYRHAATTPVTLPLGEIKWLKYDSHFNLTSMTFWSLGFHGLHLLCIFGFLGLTMLCKYLYCFTVHFEDSLNITHQPMHQLYIIY